MSRLPRLRHERDERGVALIMAIATMIVLGLLSASLIALLITGLDGRASLDASRDREYAADAAIQSAIADVRTNVNPTAIGVIACGPYTNSLNNYTIHVDCSPAVRITQGGFLQHDVVFTACENTGSPCDDSSSNPQLHSIIRAQVNFEVPPAGTSVTNTYVQTWSVNG
jgi:hypothetical protein